MALKRIYFLLTFVLLSITACNKAADSSDEVVYRVSLEAHWSQATHPSAFPEGAEISSFLACSHASYITIFDDNSLASPGLKAMAEEGSINPLDQEIQDLIDAENAYDLITSTRILSPGTASNELKVNAKNSTVSLVAKIAPSPDWFVAVKDINLYENGIWKDSILPIVIYDAGTINGSDFYTPSNPRTTPVAVSILDNGPLSQTNTPIGFVRLERIN